MSLKNKKPVSSGPLRIEVDRLIAKGRLKDAVKEAKRCFQASSIPEHHQLLERAYLLRAQQLLRDGMPTSAREVAQHLLDFGLTDPALTEPAASLFLAVGLSGSALALQEKVASPEARERLVNQAIDQAVRYPDKAPPQFRDEAHRVRRALEAIQAGDEGKATAEIREIARTSPFSDWKLFIRGLGAYHQGETADAQANWDRLDPARAPAKLVQALRDLERADGRVDDPGSKRLEGLERRVFGEPVLRPLAEIAAMVARDHWSDAISSIGSLRNALGRLDPALAHRLTEVLYGPVIRATSEMRESEAQRVLKNFTKVATALPIDPRWNRFWAFVWERQDGDHEAESFWLKYLDDLKLIPGLGLDDQKRAAGLIWLHIADQRWAEADGSNLPLGSMPSLRNFVPIRRTGDEHLKVFDALENSLKNLPDYPKTYEAYAAHYESLNQSADASKIYLRLLEIDPNHERALEFLIVHHGSNDQPERALPYVERLRGSRPLDALTLQREQTARLHHARMLALRGQFEEGRRQFELVAQLKANAYEPIEIIGRRALLELKAGEHDRARTFIDDAIETLSEPTPLWLLLRIESQRYQLAKPECDRFEKKWREGLARKSRSDTAGLMVSILMKYASVPSAYADIENDVRDLIDYLRRCTRLKFERKHLYSTCNFLAKYPKELALLEKFCNRGKTLFPDVAETYVRLGDIEMMKDSRNNPAKARKSFEKALEIATRDEQTDPIAAELLPMIKKKLATLEMLSPARGRGRPGGFGAGTSGQDMFEMMAEILNRAGISPDEFGDLIDDDDWDDEDDDEWDEDYDVMPPRPALPSPRPKAKAKAKKRPKKKR